MGRMRAPFIVTGVCGGVFAGVLGAVFAITVLALPNAAHACGLTPPIGPNGLPTTCRGDDGVRVRVGAVVGGTSTKIKLGDERASLVQGATAATIDLQPFDRFVISVAGGVALPGSLRFRDERYELLAGPIGGAGLSLRVLDGVGPLPFAQVAFTYSLIRSKTRASDGTEADFHSKDVRFGLVVGKAIGKVVAPFAFVRYFGGGTEWAPFGHGSDAYRYHVGVGGSFALGGTFDGLVEVAFLGEKRASIGIGTTF